MPTDRKAQDVDALKEAMKGCTIAIATDYSGLNVSEMSEFRTTLRENGIKYKVVKNYPLFLLSSLFTSKHGSSNEICLHWMRMAIYVFDLYVRETIVG